MTPDLEALVVSAYVFADEYPVPARPGPPARISDAELVALAVCQAAMGISSDRQFLGLVGYRLPGWFPHLPSQSQYNRRLRGLTGLLTVVQQRLARLLDAGGARVADGTLIGVANYAGCASRSEFAGPSADRRQPCPRARPRLQTAGDRERLLEPERADAARPPPRQNTTRPRTADRPTPARAHPRHPPQHTQRPPSTRTRRLRRPLTRIKPLEAGRGR